MKRIALGVLALVVVLAAALFGYFNFVRGDADEEFTLTETSAQTDSDSETGDSEDSDGEAGDSETGSDDTSDGGAEPSGPDSLDGTWSVTTGSQAGYRVVEDLRGIQDFEATGRTSDVTGSMVITGAAITDASFEVQVATIASDDERRDGQFSGSIMNTAEFPTATLTLSEPIDLGAIPAADSVINTTANGELTLRGVTNTVTFPVDAQLLDDQIEIVASVDVLFTDYGIANPTNPFVTVRDEGKVEVQLFLARS